MALFKILKGDSSRISTDVTPFRDGYAYFTPDDGGFYIDSDDDGVQARHRINPTSSVSEEITTELSNKANKAKRFTVTFPATGWVGDEPPYAQEVAVAGMTASDVPFADIVVQSTDAEGMTAELAAYACVAYFETGNNVVTAACNESVPESDLTVQFVVWDINDSYVPPADDTGDAQVIYGVEWDKVTTSAGSSSIAATSSALRRTDDSAGLSFTPQRITASGTTTGSSSFDSMPIYKDIRRCNVVNGIVAAYEGDEGFSMTPARGDVMVEIPRFYYRVTDSNTKLSIKISNKPFTGSEVSPLHKAAPGDTEGAARAYVSAYFLDTACRSSGGAAATRSTIALPGSFPSYEFPNGYKPSGLMTYATIMLLYLVEVADFDSQTAVCSVGLSTDTDVNAKSGSLGYHSGGSEVDGWCVYRGIENLWGKTPMLLYDALLFAQLNVVRTESNWSNNAVETSIRVPLAIPAEAAETGDLESTITEGTYEDTGSGYIANFAVDAAVPGIMLPTSTQPAPTAIPDQYVTSGMGTSDYLALYWGAVAETPAAPSDTAEQTETAAQAKTAVEGDVEPIAAVTPMGAGGIFSMVSALDVDCFYRMTYLPGLTERKQYKVTYVDRDGAEISTQTVSAHYPFATPPDENPTWSKGLFTGWNPDHRIAITKDTVVEPQFVLGQKKKLPVLGTYDTLEALQAAVPSPTQGDLYQIGTAPPYKVYIYVTADGWVDTGITQE